MSDKDSTSTSMGPKPRLETAALIELVRQRPCLWDRTHELYRARGEKDRAWREVYRALDPAYADMTRTHRRDFGLLINRKWANIRDSYKKYLNCTSRASASGRPYLYANLLTFLDATYIKEHKGKIYYENKESEEPEAEEQEWLNDVFVDMETREGDSPQPKRMKTEFSRFKDSESEENLVSVLVNLIEKEEDEDRAFFRSITPAVKSLSEGDKFLFRIRVMKLLDALKKKENLPSTKNETLSQDSDTE